MSVGTFQRPQRARHRVLPALAALVVLAVLPACGDKAKGAAPAPPPPPTSPVARPRPTAPPVLRSPLTGLPINQPMPVVAMKIDNVGPARPQAGAEQADVVYQELVEAGSTRLLAIFSSHQPQLAGPIRSVRENDLELLRAYGRVLFSYSGGNRGVLRAARQAPVIDASYDAATSAYHLDRGRRRPYSTFASVPALLRAKPGGQSARDVGFRFGPLPAHLAGSPPAPAATLVWSQYARSTWTWSPTGRSWLIGLDRKQTTTIGGRPLSFSNVIVQYVRIRPSRYSDVLGNTSPYSVTTGSGRALIFRDGKRIEAYWSRKGDGATHFTDAKKKDIPLATGPTWVMLAPLGRPLSAG